MTDLQLSGTIELGESYFDGKRKGNYGREDAGKSPVIGKLNGTDLFLSKWFPMSKPKHY